MMRVTSTQISGCLLALALGACSDGNQVLDGAVPDTMPQNLGYGRACASDEECTSKLCVDGFCSQICKRLSDCPTIAGQSFDCGTVAEIKKVACYPRQYRSEKYGLGYDCSLDETCGAVGGVKYTCVGMAGASDRYCTGPCKTDRECPPTFRCANVKIGNAAPERQCRRRQFCHPCAIDDQCGTGNLCINDINGNKYCGKACTTTGIGTCPTYAKCEDAGNSTLQCKHRAGYCYKGFDYEGGLCDPCVAHGSMRGSEADLTIAEEGTCVKGGFCYLLSLYTMEAACITPCETGDTCPSGDYYCFKGDGFGVPGSKLCVPSVYDTTLKFNVITSCVK
jgi:hypothetical protein